MVVTIHLSCSPTTPRLSATVNEGVLVLGL